MQALWKAGEGLKGLGSLALSPAKLAQHRAQSSVLDFFACPCMKHDICSLSIVSGVAHCLLSRGTQVPGAIVGFFWT